MASEHPDESGSIFGAVDVLAGDMLYGWAEDRRGGDTPRVTAWIGDREVGSARADIYREDLDRPVAFALRLDRAPTAAELATQAFLVRAEAADGISALLPINQGLVGAAAEQSLAELAAAVPAATLLRIVASEVTKRHPEDPFLGVVDGVEGRHVSPFFLPVGFPAPDGVAVVGHGGQLFLAGGSNDLVGQYRDARDDAAIAAAARPWAELFVRRAHALAERGIAYRQIVIPEKSSVLPELFPIPIQTPTRLFAHLEQAVGGSAMAADYVPLLAPMRALADPDTLFRGVDSHMSMKGFFFVFARLLEALGYPVPDVSFEIEMAGIGDLGIHFGGTPIYSVERVPRLGQLEKFSRGLERVELVRSGRHLGTRSLTRNQSAPFAAKVMVFGNSYFNCDGSLQNVSYWMERWFQEYHFHWSPALDFDAIDAVRPDIVIGQTIERFLNQVPER